MAIFLCMVVLIWLPGALVTELRGVLMWNRCVYVCAESITRCAGECVCVCWQYYEVCWWVCLCVLTVLRGVLVSVCVRWQCYEVCWWVCLGVLTGLPVLVSVSVCADRITGAGVTCASWSSMSASASWHTSRTTFDGASIGGTVVCRTGRSTGTPT